MDAGFELFDHTADLGLRIWAPTREQLLTPAAAALYASIGELVAGGNPSCRTLQLTADEPALLLRDFLNELLILFEREQRMATAIAVEAFTDQEFSVSLETVEINAAESALSREVKAVTYHELELIESTDGARATLIVDI